MEPTTSALTHEAHEDVLDVFRTACCIVGGGPGGAVLALLLARQGVPVTLLEAHKDFDRDFRGATPCTLPCWRLWTKSAWPGACTSFVTPRFMLRPSEPPTAPSTPWIFAG